MVYIVFVNPSILLGAYHPTDNEVSSVKFALFFATVVVSFLGTLLIGLFADVPIGMAPGMGLNAFFAFTLVGKLLGNVPNALDIALSSSIISGVLFTVIGITPLRKIIVDVIPRDLKLSIGAGIGLFIAYIGLQQTGIITQDPTTATTFGNLKK
uniref:SLC26A/SulP transporter domain-containing protein n=2 Tax=cellular organisms TaxID=131567 RepID=A0A2C9KUL3_BIOGL